MIRVLLHDAHSVISEGLRHVLEADDHVHVAAVQPKLADLPATCRQIPVDVVVMRVDRPDPEILEVLTSLAEFPTSSLMYCMTYGEGFAAQAIKAGVSACLGHGSTPADLLMAVKEVSEGRRFISPELGAQIADGGSIDEPQLSTREFEVLLALASGRNVTSVAADLSLSAKTVSTYRSRLLKKLDFQTTAQLVRYALERGLMR